MKVVISGGGTAGHVTPGLALGHELAGRGHDVSFVGTDRGVEVRMIPAAGFELHVLASRPFVRRISVQAARAPLAAASAIRACRPLVSGAGVIVGMGGYASAPAVVAARRERIPVVLHEQNAIPGLANRTLSRVAAAVALSFPQAARRFPHRVRTVLTGNPVRDAILQVRRPEERGALATEGMRAFGLERGRRTIVVFGGSLGALHVNRATIAACRLLAGRGDLQVLLITGPGNLETIRRGWPADAPPSGPVVRMEGFVDRMELAYAVADLVVARAGASSVAEISALGIPSILIPYPFAVAGEQEANGRALERADGAVVLLDGDLTGESLARTLVGLVDDPGRLASMAAGAASFGRPDAARALADLVEGAARP
jgi:UDP-N-acetylglucosamine--N-acetylmuramyl-(pentapeptide) pyrophosphoryl-undecaprenol N-acetylglucosamine transferase